MSEKDSLDVFVEDFISACNRLHKTKATIRSESVDVDGPHVKIKNPRFNKQRKCLAEDIHVGVKLSMDYPQWVFDLFLTHKNKKLPKNYSTTVQTVQLTKEEVDIVKDRMLTAVGAGNEQVRIRKITFTIYGKAVWYDIDGIRYI